jgi:hemolysin D
MPKHNHEYEFLPAALEIQDSPPSPIGRLISWLIILLLVIAVVWAYFGEVDIVAVAQGKIIPGGKDKIIQPFEIGVVKKIYVKEGQEVSKGDPLVQLDTTISAADKLRTHKELETARLDVIRLNQLVQLVSQKHSTGIQLNPFDDIKLSDEHTKQRQHQLLMSQAEEYQSHIDTIDSQIKELKAKQNVTKNILNKLEATLPLIQERFDSIEELKDKNLAPKHELLQLEQQLVEQQHDIATQKAQIEEIQTAIFSTRTNQATYKAEFKRNTIDELNKVERTIAALEQEMDKVDQRNNLQTLVAPVDGEIQQLDIHTEGGVVTPAQALMVIVPKKDELEVEALLANKDIGFVREGQTAEIKIEAFPFTKYGVIDAEIQNVSNNAIPDENLGLVYKAKVLLKQTMIQVEDKLVNLVPGMAVTVEVKTGKRRIIEYFLSPLMEYQDESVRER